MKEEVMDRPANLETNFHFAIPLPSPFAKAPVEKQKAKKKASKRKPNEAFMKPMTPSKELAAVVGEKAIPRTQVIKKIWDYIKKNNLQNPKNKRNILADTKLKPIFKGKSEVTMFELAGLIGKHLS